MCSTSQTTRRRIRAASSTRILDSLPRSSSSPPARGAASCSSSARATARSSKPGAAAPPYFAPATTRTSLLAVRLRITTGAGQRLVRVEHGSRLGDDNDQPRSEAERLIGGGFAGLVTGHTHDPELTSLGSGFYANTGSCGTA